MGEPHRIKYYNNVLFHNVQKGFLIQTGDPTGTGKGGDSVFKYARAAFSRILPLSVKFPS
jgi:cyclophilin family peptidyl-prolyl cis-trans isomerase